MKDRRIPAAYRPLLTVASIGLLLASAFAVYAAIRATGQPAVRPGTYEPFVVGRADNVGRLVQDRPLFFADPTGGDRGFVLTLVDADFAALHVVPPGRDRDCPIDWTIDAHRLEDCEGRVWAPAELARFPVHLRPEGDGRVVVVDLRRRLPPPEPAAPGSAPGSGQTVP